MFDESAEQPASERPAPIGMRELPPQPARPVMPAFPMPTPAPTVARDEGPGPDDSVIARDDHVEGTFTSRGTVVVIGSLKGRIEAVRVRIEAGARVDADVIVDEAIVAGEFSGNLTCRERLEARASGRINGHVETYKLMLHEGASVEGEMHMLAEGPRDASTTIRGTAPLRGEAQSQSPSQEPRPTSAPASALPSGPARSVLAGETVAPSGVRPAPVVTPSSAGKTSTDPSPAGVAPAPGPVVAPPATAVTPSVGTSRSSVGATPPGAAAPGTAAPGTAAPGAGPDAAAQRQRSAIVETLRLETMRVAPRATPSSTRQPSPAPSDRASNGSRGRSGPSPTGF
jgi:cytoskeletal protein CcmA (bactofilin family)